MKKSAHIAFFLLTMMFVLVSGVARADAPVPARLQAQIIGKLASFDRNFAHRARGNALILIVQKPGDADSAQLAQQMAAAFNGLGDVGGVPKTVEIVPFSTATALAATCKSRNVALVYLSTGLERDVAPIAAALAGGDVLSVGASAAHAERGTAVGFDLDGGKPKLVINLTAAKAQNVALKADVLKLARIVGG